MSRELLALFRYKICRLITSHKVVSDHSVDGTTNHFLFSNVMLNIQSQYFANIGKGCLSINTDYANNSLFERRNLLWLVSYALIRLSNELYSIWNISDNKLGYSLVIFNDSIEALI